MSEPKCSNCTWYNDKVCSAGYAQFLDQAEKCPKFQQIKEKRKKITDKQVTDRIMSKYQFYCDKDDVNTTLYIWGGAGWRDGVAEGAILNELSEIFKDAEQRYGMSLDRTVNFIKGQAMNVQLNQKPPCIIPFINGLYDVIADKLIPHDASFFYVNVIPHEFDPSATCPNWKKWLSEVVREEDLPFIQEWVGYQFYSDYPEPGFLINIGRGQNGKTILMDLLQKVIGEKNVSNVSLSDVVNGPYAMSELHQKLANISDEISNRAVRDAGPLKMLSAGSYVEARQIYGRHFNFRNYAKPTYACNEPPEFRDESDAVKYRLKAVEFPYIFRKKPREGEKQARDKKEIETELEVEIPGIINWALEGLRRLIASNFTFTESRSTEETWAFYKRKSGPVACFIEEELDFTEDSNDVLSRDQMYQAFSVWLENSKIDLNVSRDKFFKGMKACGVEATQSRTYDMQRVYIGVKCNNVTPSTSSFRLNRDIDTQQKIVE
jgi:putative DNA primase/helicase